MKYLCCSGFLACVAAAAGKVFHIGCDVKTWNRSDVAQVSLCLGLGVILFDMFRLNPAKSHTILSLLRAYWRTKVFSTFAWLARLRLERNTHKLKLCQDQILHEILDGAKRTVYAQNMKFAEMKTIADFRSIHPLTEYEHYKAYLDRIMNGEANTLFNDQVDYWAATTGTTSGKSKLYPKNKKRQFKLFFRELIAYWEEINSYPGVGGLRRAIHLNVQFEKHYSEQGVPIGPLSSIGERYLPGNVIPLSGLRITSLRSAFYVQLLFGLTVKDVSWIGAPFGSHMLTFFRMMEECWDELCIDIQMGKINKNVELTPTKRDELESLMQPDRARTIELRRIFHKGFQNVVERIWPKCSLIVFIGTGPFQAYTDIVRERYAGDIPIHSPMHMATEAIYGCNIVPQSRHTNYVLTPYSAFYEFIPLEHLDEKNPDTVLPWEVSVGQEYEFVVTTLQGLYRYRTKDIIRIVGFYNQAPMYEFVQRLGDNLDLFGEKTSSVILEDALRDAFVMWQHLELTDYTFTESIYLQRVLGAQSDKMYYTLFIEVKDDAIITQDNANQLDDILCATQEEYEVDRKAEKISRIKVIQVKTGTFEKLKHMLVSSNRNASFQQFKMPRVMRRDECIGLLVDGALERISDV